MLLIQQLQLTFDDYDSVDASLVAVIANDDYNVVVFVADCVIINDVDGADVAVVNIDDTVVAIVADVDINDAGVAVGVL